ncbi:hypothetical protein MRX96_034173 [Rhipicephalus microplus]
MRLSQRPTSPEVAAYKQCVLEAVEEYAAGNVSNSSLRELMFLPWALDLALAAALYRPHDRLLQPLEKKLRAQLFFKRFCETFCGDAEGAKVCAYVALRSRDFADAFGCPNTLYVPC